MKNPTKKERMLFYINAYSETNELMYTGITFAEFIRYLAQPMQNLMLINGGCDVIFGENEFERGLELFKGCESIENLSQQNLYDLGNFCFVDYASDHTTEKLSEEQIAELLYMGHMFEPLHSPFFDQLQNRFAYLAHDDGFFSKIYYRNIEDVFGVFAGKIKSCLREKLKKDTPELPHELLWEILRLSEDGVLIDFNEAAYAKETISVRLYTVGKITDMDVVLNTCAHLKETSSIQKALVFQSNKWVLI